MNEQQLKTHMAGKLMSFKIKDAGSDAVIDEVITVEVCEVANGEIEFAFNDRDERLYLRLPIANVLANIPAKDRKP